MDDRMPKELEEQAVRTLGSLLAEQRWKNTTPEDRRKVAMKLVAARRRKARARRKK
jgi:hypothetical protein